MSSVPVQERLQRIADANIDCRLPFAEVIEEEAAADEAVQTHLLGLVELIHKRSNF